MARDEPVAPIKLAFFVEGDSDKDFLEGIVQRILGPGAHVRVVRVGGKAAFSSTYFEALQFLQAGYASIFLVIDADTAIPEEIELQKQRLKEVFGRYGIEDRVQICMAVPMLEAWLLAAYRADPERSKHPKQALARYAGTDAKDVRALAARLPIDVARQRSQSFDELVTALEAFVPPNAKRAAGRARKSAPAVKTGSGRHRRLVPASRSMSASRSTSQRS